MDCLGFGQGLGGVLDFWNTPRTLHWTGESCRPPRLKSQCETIIASIGSILTTLLPPIPSDSGPPVKSILTTFMTLASPINPLKLRNKHVSIISLTSTVSRLFAGALADYLCPPMKAVPKSPGETPTTRSENDEEVSTELVSWGKI